MTARLNSRILLIALIVTLVMIVPVYATAYGQEATAAVEPTPVPTVEAALPESSPVAGVAEEAEGQANGVTTLVLLVGLGAVGLVGFGTLLRQNYRPPQS